MKPFHDNWCQTTSSLFHGINKRLIKRETKPYFMEEMRYEY